jgi:hypothetical protein
LNWILVRVINVKEMHPSMTTGTAKRSQVDKFKEADRELETDDSEEAFDAKLKKIAKAPVSTSPKSEKDRS